MTEIKPCVNCRKEFKLSDMKTTMSNSMHYYVCSSDCMKKFYKQEKTINEAPRMNYNLSKDYEFLYDFICSGKVAVGFVDYETGRSVNRDVCKIKKIKTNEIFASVRGCCYFSIDKYELEDSGKNEKELFIEMCKMNNLEFIIPKGGN